jgi:hypothetical protein
VADVAGGDFSFPRDSDTGNLHIADLETSTCLPPRGRNSARSLSGGFVEWNYAIVEVLAEDLIECGLQKSSTAT